MAAFVRRIAAAAAVLMLGGLAQAQEAPPASLEDLHKAEVAAREALTALMPKDARVLVFGDKLTVQTAAETKPASPELQAAFTAVTQASVAVKAREAQEAPAIDAAELAAVLKEIRDKTPPGAEFVETMNGRRLKLASGETQLLEDDLWTAVQRKEEIEQRIADRAKGAPTERTPQLRILADSGPVGQTGSFNRKGLVLTQTLVFNRAAMLTETLSAERKGYGAYDIPAGALLFVVDGANGASDPAYCLPQRGKLDMWLRAMPPWIPCYFDWDRDGALEIQTYGGEPMNGIYMYAGGFAQIGTVTKAAKFKSIPLRQGYQQRAGIWMNQETFDKATGVRKVSFELMVGPDESAMEAVAGTLQLETLTGAETKIVEYRGARIEVQASGNKLAYRIIETMPEQMFEIEAFRVWRY